MNGIGDRKVCSFCGENIANYSTDSSLDFVDTINNDVDDDSAYKFEKTINDSTSVADFTRQEMLENKETPFGGLNEHAGDNFGFSRQVCRIPNLIILM